MGIDAEIRRIQGIFDRGNYSPELRKKFTELASRFTETRRGITESARSATNGVRFQNHLENPEVLTPLMIRLQQSIQENQPTAHQLGSMVPILATLEAG